MPELERTYERLYSIKVNMTRKGAYSFEEKRPTNILSFDRVISELHPTEKPVELFQEIIKNSPDGDVYDPFLGSGTTIIAAENLSRQCRAAEIAPGYVAVSLQRYVDAFGIEPELAS